jgi:hypothetical protein
MNFQNLQERGRWLLQYAENVTSQRGEDGILSKTLEVLPERNGWCIEFGAWDGKHFSNTYNLIAAKEYRGVFIEADRERFEDLRRTYADGRHILLNAYVGFAKDDSLDALLADTEVPRDLDLVSIDIDGNDYHVWEATHAFQPKLVIIEYNNTASNIVHFVQPKDPRVNQGSSAAALVDLGAKKGYELIAATSLNLLFVKREYYPLFHIPDNSLEVMRDDSRCAQIFCGFDGRVFLAEEGMRDAISLPWHHLKLRERDVQVIPKRLQKYPYPDSYSFLERLAWRLLFGWK